MALCMLGLKFKAEIRSNHQGVLSKGRNGYKALLVVCLFQRQKWIELYIQSRWKNTVKKMLEVFSSASYSYFTCKQ